MCSYEGCQQKPEFHYYKLNDTEQSIVCFSHAKEVQRAGFKIYQVDNVEDYSKKNL